MTFALVEDVEKLMKREASHIYFNWEQISVRSEITLIANYIILQSRSFLVPP